MAPTQWFNAMRWDSTTGQYDMGFRTYDPGLNQFVSRDMYNGALTNAGLTTDPFTGSPYAFGDGNPVSNVELDGHMICADGGPCGSVQSIERYYAQQEACAKSASCQEQQQLSTFTSNVNATLAAYHNEQSCITDTTLAFWDGGNYSSYNCGFLGHATYNQSKGTLVWTPTSGSGGKTQVICDWYTDCAVTGSAVISAGKVPGPVAGASYSVQFFSAPGESQAAGAAAASGGGSAADGAAVRLFRAVDANEFDSIASSGKFTTAPGQMEGKFFATSGEDAQQWAEKLYGGDAVVVTTRIPQSVADQLFLREGKLDGIGPAYYADEEQLGMINEYMDEIDLWP